MIKNRKSEADHIRGWTNVSTNKKIGAAALFSDAGNMVEILLSKYDEKEHPKYQVKSRYQKMNKTQKMLQLKDESFDKN